jgi:hypothetical protein
VGVVGRFLAHDLLLFELAGAGLRQ